MIWITTRLLIFCCANSWTVTQSLHLEIEGHWDDSANGKVTLSRMLEISERPTRPVSNGDGVRTEAVDNVFVQRKAGTAELDKCPRF